MEKVLFLIFILAIGCTSQEQPEIPEHIEKLDSLTIYPADAQPEMQIELAEERRFGSTDEVLVGSVGDFAVSDQSRVFIFDTGQHTIHVFDKDGTYMTNIGRNGTGPGEFGEIASLSVKNGLLIAHDSMKFRINVFSLETFSLDHTLNLNQMNTTTSDSLRKMRPEYVYYLSKNILLTRFSEPMIFTDPSSSRYNLNDRVELYYLMDRTDEEIISEQILKLNKLRALTATVRGEFLHTQFLFLGESLFALSDAHNIYTARTEDFLIEVRDSTGTLQRAFYYPLEKKEFTREEAIRRQRINYQKSVSDHRVDVISNAPEEQMPEWWPVLSNMVVDDRERLWVSVIVDELDVWQWWVLDNRGKLLARFDWPKDKKIRIIKNGKVYTSETDEETGLTEIVRYGIEMSN